MGRSLVIFALLIIPIVLKSQIITTISGTSSALYDPGQIAFDKYGNLYCGCALCNKIVKIDTSGVISVFAGTGVAGYSGDSGLATSAQFNQPGAITTDTFGNVYIADGGNNRIRKVDITTGIITTIAGIGTPGFGGDSALAIYATLHCPSGLHFDKYGNLYLADFCNDRLRKIDTSGIITTIAGNGTLSSDGDGGLAYLAKCDPDYNMCTDNLGNLFFIDQANYTVRKINTSGIITTIAGDSTGGYVYTGDGAPALGTKIAPGAIAFNNYGLLVISDYYNNRVYIIDSNGIINTIAGNGIDGYSGDSGLATSAEVGYPSGIAFDHCGNLFIAMVDYHLIRKVAFNPACWPLEVPKIVSKEIAIYPNPSTSEINVDGVKTEANYALLNITGNMLQNGTLQKGNSIISIQSLPPGMYLLELKDSEGQKTVTKIVKL